MNVTLLFGQLSQSDTAQEDNKMHSEATKNPSVAEIVQLQMSTTVAYHEETDNKDALTRCH